MLAASSQVRIWYDFEGKSKADDNCYRQLRAYPIYLTISGRPIVSSITK